MTAVYTYKRNSNYNIIEMVDTDTRAKSTCTTFLWAHDPVQLHDVECGPDLVTGFPP